MKKIVFKIRQNTKALILGLSLFGVVGIAATVKKTTVSAQRCIAFVTLVGALKKKKEGEEKSVWDGLNSEMKSLVEGFDIVLKELATNVVDESKVKEQITDFEKKYAFLSGEEKKAFDDTVDSVKKMAGEIQKMKDAGFQAEEVLPYGQAFSKALKENKEQLAALKGQKNGEVVLSFKAAAIMGTGNVSNTSAPTLPATTVMSGLNAAPRNEPFILDLVDNGSMNTPTIIWFNKVNRENGSAMIAEGDLKPLSDFDIEGETSSVKKIATAFNVSEEMLTDIPFIESEIKSEGVENLRIAIEDQIINGDGTGNNLKGILQYASVWALPAIEDTVTDANEYDVILAGNTMLETLNHKANGVLVHPTTRFKLRTIKDANGNYVIPPSADKNAVNIDGLPVIAKNQITAGKFLMADFKKSHVRFLMDINVRVGYNSDDFRKNRVTFLIEARLTHFIKDVETSAFIYDEFDVVKAALEAPGL